MNNFLLKNLIAIFVLFHYGCTAQNKPISVEINQDSKKNISNYLFGYNTQLMRGPSWSDEKFITAVKNLYPQNLRFPGGTNANYWDWKSGWIKTDIPIRKEWQSLKVIPYKLSDLKIAYDATQATPIFVLNLLTSTLSEQMEMLHAAQQSGIPVQLIELGNEFYIEDSGNKSVFPTAQSYAQIANQYIVAIKKDFPTAKIAVVGNSLRDGQLNDKKVPARFLNWNDGIYKNVKGADAITFHVYGGSGLELIPTNENKAKHTQRSDYTEPEKQIYQTAFDDRNSVSKTLGVPYTRNSMVKDNDIAKIPAGWKVWITEYNLFENEGVVAGTWAHGIYAASQALLLISNPKTDLICYHDIAHGAQFGAIFNNENGFNGFLKNTPTTIGFYTASGYTLQLIAEAMKGKAEMSNLKFSNSLSTFFFKNKNYPALIGFKFSNGNKSSFVLLNLSEQKVTVDLKNVIPASSSYKQLSGNPRQQISKQEDITVSNGSINGPLDLAPYSVTKVE